MEFLQASLDTKAEGFKIKKKFEGEINEIEKAKTTIDQNLSLLLECNYSIIANYNASDQTQPHFCEYEEILTPPSNFFHSIYGIDYQYYNEQNHNNIVDEKYKLYHEEKWNKF